MWTGFDHQTTIARRLFSPWTICTEFLADVRSSAFGWLLQLYSIYKREEHWSQKYEIHFYLATASDIQRLVVK
jgi:hypothetical protein